MCAETPWTKATGKELDHRFRPGVYLTRKDAAPMPHWACDVCALRNDKLRKKAEAKEEEEESTEREERAEARRLQAALETWDAVSSPY